ncbi:hypothetical protein Tco_0713142 [Tanacetum coccineum]
MSALKFADSYNMVTFLPKPTESEGFEQIVDFLNANPIKYTLTVNLTIFTSCIEQFWATTKIKTVNGEVQLHALVDMKKVIITESTIRRDLQLEDAEVFLDKQVGDMSTHDEIFVRPSHTKKVFSNIKRVGKGFSRAVTPLFPTMMVQAQEEMGEGLANPDPHHTPIITQKKQKTRKPKRKDTKIPQSSSPTKPIADEAANEENVPTHSNDPLLSGEDRLKLTKLMTLCTNLQNRGRYDDAQMFDTDVFNGEEVFVAKKSEKVVEEVVSTDEVSTAETITTKEINLAQALAQLRTKEEEQARLVREKAEKVKEANISWDNVQAMIEADRLLVERLQVREQEELTDEEKARLFVELLEKRKKHFAALRA